MKNLPDNMGKLLATTFVVCGVLIERDGKYLLLQEKQQKAYGLWNFPGGKVDEGETLEQAAVREAKEECGYNVELTGRKHVVHQSIESPVIHTFAAKISGGELSLPDDEIMDAKWFTKDEIVAMRDKLRNQERMLGAIEALASAS